MTGSVPGRANYSLGEMDRTIDHSISLEQIIPLLSTVSCYSIGGRPIVKFIEITFKVVA